MYRLLTPWQQRVARITGYSCVPDGSDETWLSGSVADGNVWAGEEIAMTGSGMEALLEYYQQNHPEIELGLLTVPVEERDDSWICAARDLLQLSDHMLGRAREMAFRDDYSESYDSDLDELDGVGDDVFDVADIDLDNLN